MVFFAAKDTGFAESCRGAPSATLAQPARLTNVIAAHSEIENFFMLLSTLPFERSRAVNLRALQEKNGPWRRSGFSVEGTL